MKFPTTIYVSRDTNSNDDEENLLAWTDVKSADVGRIAIYSLESVVEKREVVELRRERTKNWFKAD
jgi:hypothetical protein